MPDLDTIKKYGWHLKVLGAYVQEPTPSVVGLDERTVIASNDAAALYPTGIIYSNIGFDTIRDRVYDGPIVRKLLSMIEQVFKMRDKNPGVKKQAIDGFTKGLQQALKDYLSRKSVANAKEATEFTLDYYPTLLSRIFDYEGGLENIFSPKTDVEYYLLKSCLFPLLETITWLSPQNYGYNQTMVEYVFFHEEFIQHPRKIYIFKEINSTKTTFEILDFEDALKHFKKRIINPYGILFDRHEDNLAYDVELLIEALAKRRVIKNQMLVLEAIVENWDKIPEDHQMYFKHLGNDLFLSEEQADDILNDIEDPSDIREYRIKSLYEIEINASVEDIKSFLDLRASQMNIVQKGIKVAANSAYGIFGLITWPFASPLIGNAITNAGKIYGIKLFQAVSVEVLSNIKKETHAEKTS